MHLRCRLTKNSPRRTASTSVGVFCTLLASASPIFKSAGCKGLPFVAVHKLILAAAEINTRLPFLWSFESAVQFFVVML